MKTKILSLAVALLSTTFLFSQSTLGIRGGVNFNTLSSKDFEGEKIDTKLQAGFNIGVNVEIPIGIDFYVQPGLLYSRKGGEYKITPKTRINISYVEIPVNFIYKPSLGKGNVLVGLGPYLGIAVGGKFKVGDAETDIKFANEAGPNDPSAVYFRRMDAGANFLFGYEFVNRFSVQLNAGLGLANIQTKEEDEDMGDASIKNTGFGISLGYRFGK